MRQLYSYIKCLLVFLFINLGLLEDVSDGYCYLNFFFGFFILLGFNKEVNN